MKNRVIHVLLQLFIFWWFSCLESAKSQSLALPGCADKCGNISIPYPFGIGHGCFLEEAFSVVCRKPGEPLIERNNLRALDILLEGRMRVPLKPAYNCFDPIGKRTNSSEIAFQFSQFAVSNTMNKLIGVGCGGAKATLYDPENFEKQVFCLTGPPPLYNLSLSIGYCDGHICCQAPVPGNMTRIRLSTANVSQNVPCGPWNIQCSYAFLDETVEYKPVESDLSPSRREGEKPVTLDWWVGKTRCREAKKDLSSYACKSRNSFCLNSKNGPGYLCNCSDGYKGNPFIPNGCQDLDECEDPSLNNCLKHEYCQNLKGNYTCICPKGSHGDGRRGGTGCTTNGNGRQLVKILVGTIIGLLAMFVGVCWIYWTVRHRKIIKLREKFFERNGGFLLHQQLSKLEQSGDQTRVFTEEELKKATENYHEGRILGQGGQGTVYKGILPNNRIVAIKKAKIGESSPVEDFINELVVLSQINHRNVVKLLGCCLETEVPLLVYEFVNNGTLSDHIHIHSSSSGLPWENRLKIAIETANAVSYLHSAASVPIIHRDIKSANILLDYNYTSKVSDFGTSRLIPMDKEQLTTLVRGTLGYLDPEYFHTSRLNEKSDVYSFGVVLLELLSGERPLCFRKAESERYLVQNFLFAMQENRLLEIIDKRILEDGNFEQLQLMADLAVRCVRFKGDDRPSMREVAVELEGLRAINKTLLAGNYSSTDEQRSA